LHDENEKENENTDCAFFVSCGVWDRRKEQHLSLSSMVVVKATKGLTACPPEIDCNQMAMGL
jgi:hypothetical protein